MTDFDDDFSDLGVSSVNVSEDTSIKRSRSDTPRQSGNSSRKPSQRKLNNLQQSLSAQMFQAGTMIGFGLPVTGFYLAQESDNFTGAIVQLASKNAAWLKALEQVSEVQPGITVGRVSLGLLMALSVDRRKEPLDARSDRFQRIAAFMGVSAAYHSIYGASEENFSDEFEPAPNPVAFVSLCRRGKNPLA